MALGSCPPLAVPRRPPGPPSAVLLLLRPLVRLLVRFLGLVLVASHRIAAATWPRPRVDRTCAVHQVLNPVVEPPVVHSWRSALWYMTGTPWAVQRSLRGLNERHDGRRPPQAGRVDLRRHPPRMRPRRGPVSFISRMQRTAKMQCLALTSTVCRDFHVSRTDTTTVMWMLSWMSGRRRTMNPSWSSVATTSSSIMPVASHKSTPSRCPHARCRRTPRE